ncbi:hypothetical protein CK203_106924 [Vitis vinifera]|uniref:Uncharacterized protein n=1 Tax=Vitis vinifera TaxID=29760 RepID=A0A438CDW7_VITVI|nr:hypothetical protein CK203_106924 [Vitis vinifera]
MRIHNLSDFKWSESTKTDPTRWDRNRREIAQELAVQALASPVALRVVINYIHGGLIDDRHSSKRQSEGCSVQPLPKLGEGGFEVRRILVDPGSSTDLLQMSTYKQMNYLPST